MEILQVVALGLVVAVFAVLLRRERPEMAMLLALGFGVIVFLMVLNKLGAIITVFQDVTRRAQVDELYLATLLKILGIAYIAEFGAQVCRDSGEGMVANKIELAGKVLIMILALPIFAAILEVIIRLLP
ncbi:MAG: stage III sporulation protein AD [Thermacetogeniaceae bacterium]